jgi:hypothetical protein
MAFHAPGNVLEPGSLDDRGVSVWYVLVAATAAGEDSSSARLFSQQ